MVEMLITNKRLMRKLGFSSFKKVCLEVYKELSKMLQFEQNLYFGLTWGLCSADIQ